MSVDRAMGFLKASGVAANALLVAAPKSAAQCIQIFA